MASNRKRSRKIAVWRAYQRRIDRLVADQWKWRLGHPMRTNPGFFRAEGWTRQSMVRTDLRHGS